MPKDGTTSWEAWLARDRHTITLPSGAVVTIKLLTLPDHFALANTPDGLRRAALGEFGQKLNEEGDTLTAEERNDLFDGLREYYERIVFDCLIEPRPPEGVTPTEMSESLPERDRDMILAIQQRDVNVDAAGQELPFRLSARAEQLRRIRDGEANGAADETVGPAVPANRATRRRARAVPAGGGRDAAH